jgi:hypothetical protein
MRKCIHNFNTKEYFKLRGEEDELVNDFNNLSLPGRWKLENLILRKFSKFRFLGRFIHV